jgi:putative PIN family toxin of toxin-antitoxin system
VVIDTNVALDWLAFADPGVRALRAAIEDGLVVWWSCEATRRELAHLLFHADLQRWAHDAPAALALHDRLARSVPTPAPAPVSLRCRDVDDQVFVDLSLACRARWLLSKDRALLALARRADAHGLRIVPPTRWLP